MYHSYINKYIISAMPDADINESANKDKIFNPLLPDDALRHHPVNSG